MQKIKDTEIALKEKEVQLLIVRRKAEGQRVINQMYKDREAPENANKPTLEKHAACLQDEKQD